MRLSNSKANTWRRCPKKFFYKYELGLRPKKRTEALEKGSWIHELLQAHYEGESWKAKHRELEVKFYKLFEEEREELGDLPGECLRIMRSYIRRWKKEDQKYTFIDAELDEILTLPNGLKFNFIIDLIVEDDLGGIWLWDHKTTKSNFLDQDYMLLDAQLARYFWAAEEMGYTPLRGVMFNEIRTKAPAIPEVLKSGGLSQRKNIDTDYYTYLREIRRLGLDPGPYSDLLHRLKGNTARFFRRTTMPKDRGLTKRTMLDLTHTAQEILAARKHDRFPRSVNKTCTWDCEFKDVCITELFGADPTSLIKANFTSYKDG